MTRFAALATVILASATVAHAQPAVQAAQQEAIGFLKPCHQKSREDVVTCEQNQLLFVEAYVYAKGGAPFAMLQVASYFGPRRSADEREASIGIPEDHVLSCAWLIMDAARTNTNFNPGALDFSAHRICPGASEKQYGAAFMRAGRLAREFNASQPFDPPSGWRPHIPWIKGNPLGHLDSTAKPFGRD